MKYGRSIFWVAIPVLCALCAAGEEIRVGDSREKVISLRGTPNREIQTTSGAVLFYGPLLVSVENGCVTFLSLGNQEPRQEPVPAIPDPPPQQEQVSLDQAEYKTRSPTWLEEGQARHTEILVDRIRRCVALEVYDRMLARIPWRVYYDGRHNSYGGQRSLFQHTGASKMSRQTGDELPDGVCFVDLKDAQSFQVAAYGADRRYGDQCNGVRQMLSLSGGWAPAR